MLASTWRPYLPAGTVAAAKSILTPLFARSFSVLILPGLLTGIITTSLFFTKTCEEPTRPALLAFCMLARSAEAKISAGGPLVSRFPTTRGTPKVNLTEAVGCARLYFAAILVNKFPRDAAGETLKVTWPVVVVVR